MGGILAAPKAPPAPVIVQQPQSKPIAVDDGTDSRIDQIERQRRGRSGTVQTSDRGLLAPSTDASQKKTLLGE